MHILSLAGSMVGQQHLSTKVRHAPECASTGPFGWRSLMGRWSETINKRRELARESEHNNANNRAGAADRVH